MSQYFFLFCVCFIYLKSVKTQNASGNVPWWELLNIPVPQPAAAGFGPLTNFEIAEDPNTCCECVPFYLCGPDNRIVTDGGEIISARAGPATRVTNVVTCSEATQFCCRVPTAAPDCTIEGTPPVAPERRDPNTPCECIHWEFCNEELRITDGTLPTTFVAGRPLEAHSQCNHSLAVCCAFPPEDSGTPPVTVPLPASGGSPSDCFCVNPNLCGPDGFIITNGAGSLNLRAQTSLRPPCLEPKVCCREPPNLSQPVPTRPRVVNTTIAPVTNQHCNGIRNNKGVSVRIAGFKEGESQFGEFPWVGMVLRTYFVAETAMNAFIGGGILIHQQVLLTAAHKVINEDVNSLTVRVGEWDIETDFEPGNHQSLAVSEVVVHPQFDSRTLYHDVALLILREPVVLEPHIRTICIAESLNQVNTTECVINGWGKDSFETGKYQTIMKSVTLPLVPHARCQGLLRRTRLGRWFVLHPSFVCAGGAYGKDACSSDGGGPLACARIGSNTNEYLLVGVTAWGIECGMEDVPGVYASTIADRQWITSQLNTRFLGRSVTKREAEDEDTLWDPLSQTEGYPLDNQIDFSGGANNIIPLESEEEEVEKLNSNPYVR